MIVTCRKCGSVIPESDDGRPQCHRLCKVCIKPIVASVEATIPCPTRIVVCGNCRGGGCRMCEGEGEFLTSDCDACVDLYEPCPQTILIKWIAATPSLNPCS